MNYKFEFLCGFSHQPDSYVNFHKHTCCELIYYKNGKGSTIINSDKYNYSENTYSIVKPGTMHDEKHEAYTEVLFAGFIELNGEMQLENGIYKDNEHSKILDILEEIKIEMVSKNAYFEEKLNLLLNELIIEHKRINKDDIKLYDEFYFVKKFISENLSYEIDLKTLSDISGYSYHHFRHLFKKKTGTSPISYIIGKRIDRAKHLLTATSLSISDIAGECGFPTSAQFCYTFKKITGYTPLKYRKSDG